MRPRLALMLMWLGLERLMAFALAAGTDADHSDGLGLDVPAAPGCDAESLTLLQATVGARRSGARRSAATDLDASRNASIAGARETAIAESDAGRGAAASSARGGVAAATAELGADPTPADAEGRPGSGAERHGPGGRAASGAPASITGAGGAGTGNTGGRRDLGLAVLEASVSRALRSFAGERFAGTVFFLAVFALAVVACVAYVAAFAVGADPKGAGVDLPPSQPEPQQADGRPSSVRPGSMVPPPTSRLSLNWEVLNRSDEVSSDLPMIYPELIMPVAVTRLAIPVEPLRNRTFEMDVLGLSGMPLMSAAIVHRGGAPSIEISLHSVSSLLAVVTSRLQLIGADGTTIGAISPIDSHRHVLRDSAGRAVLALTCSGGRPAMPQEVKMSSPGSRGERATFILCPAGRLPAEHYEVVVNPNVDAVLVVASFLALMIFVLPQAPVPYAAPSSAARLSVRSLAGR